MGSIALLAPHATLNFIGRVQEKKKKKGKY
jgi:2'-5' RNA ligase